MAADRRLFIRKVLISAGLLYVFPKELIAGGTCDVKHPFMPPNGNFSGECHNCGMTRPMWARTWHSYTLDGQMHEVCSMHCLAEALINSGNEPQKIEAALYLDPTKSVDAEKAFYVVGSKARGTMTMKSKLAFPSKKEAEDFANSCGGSVLQFKDAYQLAAATVVKENEMINRNRISKGKIVEPLDNKDICPVCDMYPARYPQNKCQLQTKGGEVVHFCSTQCLFEYLKNPQSYGMPELKVKATWVVDYTTGKWIFAKNAYYVLGTEVRGPMGKEAYPFVNLEDARSFSKDHSGTIKRFSEVTIEQIMS